MRERTNWVRKAFLWDQERIRGYDIKKMKSIALSEHTSNRAI